MGLGIIPIGFDRSPTPQDGLLAIAQVIFRDADLGQPHVGRRIARAQAERLVNVSLGFLGATGKDLAKSDEGMSVGEIAIQRQRVLAFGDALERALRQDLNIPEKRMAAGVVRERRQSFRQLRFGGGEGRRRVGDKRISAVGDVGRRRSNERVDIVGIGGERAIEKLARLRNMVRGPAPMEPGQALKKEIHRVGVGRLFGASRLGGGELGVQRVRQTPNDFVLHVEEIGERLVEPLRPKMTAGLGVDELHVDAHAISAALNAALEDIANIQVAADGLHVERLALVSESRVAGDHDGAPDTREIGRETLRDPVDEVLLFRVAADIGERQNNDRETRRAGFFRRRGRRGFRCAGWPTSSE